MVAFLWLWSILLAFAEWKTLTQRLYTEMEWGEAQLFIIFYRATSDPHSLIYPITIYRDSMRLAQRKIQLWLSVICGFWWSCECNEFCYLCLGRKMTNKFFFFWSCFKNHTFYACIDVDEKNIFLTF